MAVDKGVNALISTTNIHVPFIFVNVFPLLVAAFLSTNFASIFILSYYIVYILHIVIFLNSQGVVLILCLTKTIL